MKSDKLKYTVNSLLNQDETYTNNSEKKYVAIDERLKSVYNAIFLANDDAAYEEVFGILNLNRGIIHDLRNTLSGLSRHSYIERA